MSNEIQNGTILISQGARVPASIQKDNQVYAQAWQIARRLNQNGLLRLQRLAGWQLFSFDTTIEIQVSGFDDKRAIRAAIRRIVARIRAKSFNCLEIKRVEMQRCLGFPFVSVSVHSWHIQAQ